MTSDDGSSTVEYRRSQEAPSWLVTPPSSQVEPPTDTSPQELPFGALTWEDFEKLCWRLVRTEADVEHCQLYGERGQNQSGIDIYARKKSDGGYAVYQCKKVRDFGPADLKAAVETFLKGKWADSADVFVLCTEVSLVPTGLADELENQSAAARAKGVTLLAWDLNELSAKLKDLPALVDDFFGRGWVALFCGEEHASALGDRLTGEEVTQLRDKLGSLYGYVFDAQDPGLPAAAQSDVPSPALSDRYVLPDVYEGRTVEFGFVGSGEDGTGDLNAEDGPRSDALGVDVTAQAGRRVIPHHTSRSYRQRRAVGDWLASGPRSVVLGGPGSGKSSLLRYLALDMLKDGPELATPAREWGGFLPVWVPFAFWTKAVADQAAVTRSLGDVVRSWLEHFDESRLWPLVRKALEDERLLLLVDGLDEYTDEGSAAVALGQLQVFVQQRNVPAVVTSRPHGFDRLGMQTGGWQVTELAELSWPQQGTLARAWFLHRFRHAQVGREEVGRDEHEAAATQAARFLDELREFEDIGELARVPLLLSLLVYLRFVDARLPQNRFKAYSSIVEHLVAKHPHRRRAAALVAQEPHSDLSDDEALEGFAFLAFRMQESFGEGLVEQEQAEGAFREYLEDEELGLGYARAEARAISRRLLEVGENTVGLLVKRSPTQVGFFHRAFQEFLAASHLSRLPLEEQLTVIDERCAEPQWREVMLGLFYLTRRSADARRYVERVEDARERFGEVDRLSSELLLFEVACGDFNCPVALAKELATRAVERVELGAWMPHRERVLTVVLEGLRSSKVRDIVANKTREWFPAWQALRAELFAAVSGWPRNSEAEGLLWRAIHDEDGFNRRAAARAMADFAGGDSDLGERLAVLASGSLDPGVRASATEAMVLGWPRHRSLGGVLGAARNSLSSDLRVAAIKGRVSRQEHDDDDRAELLRLASRNARTGYEWRAAIVTILTEGWPQSPETKETCFAALAAHKSGQHELEKDTAERILLEGYPQDDEVAEYCASQIRTERHPFVLLFSEAWEMLARNFTDHPAVVAAIDEWLSPDEKRFIWNELSPAALIGRTWAAKDKLLAFTSDDGVNPRYVRTLLDGWGMHDSEVAERLTRIAMGPVPAASRIGELLPRIISDRDRCRQRLLELLEDPDCESPNAIIQGLKNLGVASDEPKVLDIVFDVLPNRVDTSEVPYREATVLLMESHGNDERLKRLAEKELFRPDEGYFSLRHLVAAAYSGDAEMRRKVARTVCPLPANLRERVAARVGSGLGDDDFALPLLGSYDYEINEVAKVRASIAYHERLKASGRDTSEAVRRLSDALVAYGPDLDARRQAAFCGLASLGRLDLLLEAEERSGRPCTVPLATTLSPNVLLLEYVLRNWDEIKSALGDEFSNRIVFSRLSLDDEEGGRFQAWDAFCAFADEHPSPREEALGYLEQRQERSATPNVLRFLSRVRPGGTLFREYCLGTLAGGSELHYPSTENADAVAAELLGAHFAGDAKALEFVSEQLLDDGDGGLVVREAPLIALCEGWPESEELQRALRVVQENQQGLSYAAYFQLASLFYDGELLLEDMRNMLLTGVELKDGLRDTSGRLTKPLSRRLRADEEFRVRLEERLQDTPTPSEKATLPRLIASSNGIRAELRAWCTAEIVAQSRRTPPEVGFDLGAGEVRPVMHSLLSALDVRSHSL